MSKMQWFRLYNRIVDNDKLKLLAFEDRWHFVALCALKSDGLLDEPVSDLRSRRVAAKLGVQGRELEEISRRLREVELIDADLNPVAWDELQFKTDNSTARVQAYRKRQQKQPRNKVKRFGNVSETAQETEAETDIPSKDGRASSDALKPAHIFDEWNLTAEAIGLRTVRDRTAARVQLVKARIGQYSLEDFVSVFGKVKASDFLAGRTERWKGATFDWVMQRKNFVKVLEGNYDD